jgi:hypothetical protein
LGGDQRAELLAERLRQQLLDLRRRADLLLDDLLVQSSNSMVSLGTTWSVSPDQRRTARFSTIFQPGTLAPPHIRL